MKRVLYILQNYPQFSETYKETEIRALSQRFDVQILSLGKPDLRCESYHSYTSVRDVNGLIAAAKAVEPHIIHGHYTTLIPLISRVARAIDVPFTIRSHSFDVFGPGSEKLSQHRDIVNSSLCVGVLGFPPTMDLFVQAGWAMPKLVSCPPVIEYDWFYDRSPNGTAIMNVGACLPKKKMEDFVLLGARIPGKILNLYALVPDGDGTGYSKKSIAELNEVMGRPVNIMPPIEPRLMPAEYKKHEWLVYTARDLTVGWPMAVAEAQASGVGVCLQRVRGDMVQYVGGAGYLFDTLAEAAAIIAKPLPEEMRERGFHQAQKSNVHDHINLLLDRWRTVF